MNLSKPFILIVEDDKQIASLVSSQLEAAGMRTQTFNRVSPVLRFLEANFANLVLLDVNLPDGNGFLAAEELRSKGIQTPIIFLTGEEAESAKVRGLQGADDYITKPFSFPELIARIHAVLRRTETAQDSKVTRNASVAQDPFDFCGALVIPAKLEIQFSEGIVEKIGRKELGIIAHLAANPDMVVVRKSLIHAVWGIHADVRSRSLDQYIVKIRNVYTRHGLDMSAFKTIHGVGYTYQKSHRR